MSISSLLDLNLFGKVFFLFINFIPELLELPFCVFFFFFFFLVACAFLHDSCFEFFIRLLNSMIFGFWRIVIFFLWYNVMLVFLVLYEWFLGWYIWRSKFFASLGEAFLTWFCQASVISLVLSCFNGNLKRQTLKPLACHSSWTDRVIALRSVLQLRVTAQIYLENSKKVHPRGVRACQPKDAKRKESPGPLAPLFICPPPPGPALCKLGQPGVLFVLPEVLTPVRRPSFVLFSRAFPFLVF